MEGVHPQPEGDRNDITSEPITNEHHDHQPDRGQSNSGLAATEAPSRTELPTTYAEAIGHNPYELLRELHDHSLGRHETEVRNGADPRLHLAELALSSAVIRWWSLWQPIVMHRALKASASLTEVGAATGTTATEVYRRWSTWAEDWSTTVLFGDKPTLDPAEVAVIRERIGSPP